jgi:hypothetical protein
MLQAQQARLFSLAYSLASHVLVDSDACELSSDFSFATAIAQHIIVSDPPFVLRFSFQLQPICCSNSHSICRF